MRKFISLMTIAILISLFIIFIFFIISSWLKTEKPGFVTVCVFSFLTSILVANRYPDTKWYLPVVIYTPLFLLLIIAYNGEGIKTYITNILVCILISYMGTVTGAWLRYKSKNEYGRPLKTILTAIGVTIVIILTIYLSERNSRLDKPLIAVLDTIFKADQSLIQENKVWDVNSPEWKSWNKKYSMMDSVNVIKVIDIVNKYGWPGEDIIGWYGSSTLWVIIQHSTLENQEKFLPLIREAVRKGRVRPGQLALLKDRILINQGKEQIYGTQITTDSLGKRKFWAIKDEQNVNKRRFSAGLGPIGWYAKEMGVKYEPRKPEGK